MRGWFKSVVWPFIMWLVSTSWLSLEGTKGPCFLCDMKNIAMVVINGWLLPTCKLIPWCNSQYLIIIHEPILTLGIMGRKMKKSILDILKVKYSILSMRYTESSCVLKEHRLIVLTSTVTGWTMNWILMQCLSNSPRDTGSSTTRSKKSFKVLLPWY